MAITSLDGAVVGALPPEPIIKAAATAEAAGVLHSMFYVAGLPGAAAAPTPGLAGAALTTYAGQLPFPAAVGGKNIHLYAAEFAQAAAIGGVQIVDRLWHNSGFTITTTTAQTVNSVAWPARDRNGSTNGVGVMVAIEVSATCGNGAVTNTTLQYTNSDGTASRTGTMASFPASAVAGAFVPFMLQAGDVGVRSIQSLTLGTTYVSGTIHLVAFRPVAGVSCPVVNIPGQKDVVQLGMPRMYDSSVPMLIARPTGTGMGVVDGQITYTQG